MTLRPIVTQCRSCKADIVWMWTVNNKKAPVNADTVALTDDRQTQFDPERHMSHFATCPQSKRWKK